MAMQLNSTDVMYQPLRSMTAASIADNFVKLGVAVGSDAAEGGTTDTVIAATGHAAVAGDQIIMTSGGEDGEAREVLSVTANAITLVSALSGAPSAAETFNIERPVRQSAVRGGFMVRMENNTNHAVEVSYDGVNIHHRLSAGDVRDFNYKSNNLQLPRGFDTATDDGLNGFVFLRARSTSPTTGEFDMEVAQ